MDRRRRNKTIIFFYGLHDLCVLHNTLLVGPTGKQEGAVVSVMAEGSMLKRSRQDFR